MKSIDGRAQAVVSAGAEECFAVLAAVHRYPLWMGDLVRRVEVLEWAADDRPATARVAIHVERSPLHRDFEFVGSVTATPAQSVRLTRVACDPSDREQLEIAWQLHPDAGTRIEVSFHAATPRLPSFLPLGGVGDEIAGMLLGAAVDALDRPAGT